MELAQLNGENHSLFGWPEINTTYIFNYFVVFNSFSLMQIWFSSYNMVEIIFQVNIPTAEQALK